MSRLEALAPEPVPPAAAADDEALRVDRLVSTGARDTLERLRGSDLLTGGGVHLIGLDAIRTRMGDRWPAKRIRVWENAEREIARTLGPRDVVVRVDDVNYLIALPGESGAAAQAACLTILRQVLLFFLGEALPADLSVRTITDIADGAIVSTKLDPAKFSDPAFPDPKPPAPAAPLAEPDAEAQAWVPPLAGRSSYVPLVSASREKLDLTLRVEAVWNLKRGLVSSFLIERLTDGAAREAYDLEQIDRATMAYAIDLLDEQDGQGGGLTLHMPLSFATLAASRSRLGLLRQAQSVRGAMRASVLLEICDLDPGVPSSRLVEVVALVKPFWAGVLGRIQPSRKALEAVRGCGLMGVVVEADTLVRKQSELPARLGVVARAVKEVSPIAIVHGLPSVAAIDDATAAGFTHASVAPGPLGD